MAKSRNGHTILAIRFSAMGDVAMTIPVMREVLEAYPDLTIVFVTNKNWGALCEGIPRLVFFPADLKGVHRGVRGLYRLFKALRAAHPGVEAVADLHHVLRSRVLRTFYRLAGIRVSVIDKGRKEKQALTRKENKVLKPLVSTISRYREVFRGVGYGVAATDKPAESRGVSGRKKIGIAPFATYKEKTYPLEKMEEVIIRLLERQDLDILLFGGGASEVEQLNALAEKYPRLQVMAGRYSLKEELAIIRELNLMVSMDSANMHLASLYGVPVVSVWGATHPFAGFMGYGQLMGNAVETDLYCRPCSVFGNKPCFRGDHACMEQLPPELILQRIREIV